MTTISFQIDNAQDTDLILGLLRRMGAINIVQDNNDVIDFEEVLTEEHAQRLSKRLTQTKDKEHLMTNQEVRESIRKRYGI